MGASQWSRNMRLMVQFCFFLPWQLAIGPAGPLLWAII
jgi:hypothetical protein